MRNAVNQPGHDQVLVIDGGGSLARALFGDVMAEIASRNGWAGLVINGAIRDSVEIDAMDIGVKALGTVPRRGERTGAGEVDVPVSFGGIEFTPGNRLVADEDGVIVLPAGVRESDIDVSQCAGCDGCLCRVTAGAGPVQPHDGAHALSAHRRCAHRAPDGRRRAGAAVRGPPGAQRVHQSAGVRGAARRRPRGMAAGVDAWPWSTTSIPPCRSATRAP